MSKPILQVEELTKTYHNYRRGDVVAIDGISFLVNRGEVIGLLGPNGAGKTTTIKCLCTLIRPTSGHIAIDGVNALTHPRDALTKIAAVLEGNRNIYWRLTPRENLRFFAGLQGIQMKRIRSSIDQLIEFFNLREKMNTPARMLSRGMQQKLALACALVKQTKLLLLDEPTLGLDVEASYELRKLLREMVQREQRTVLLSSHDMNVVKGMCDRVIIINQGRIVTDDTVSNLLEVFKARAYEVILSGHLNESQQCELKERFESIQINTGIDRSTIQVEFLKGRRFYELIDILRENGSMVESINHLDPDLEEIFLKVVQGDK